MIFRFRSIQLSPFVWHMTAAALNSFTTHRGGTNGSSNITSRSRLGLSIFLLRRTHSLFPDDTDHLTMLCPRWKVNKIHVVLCLAIVWSECDILSRVAGDASSLSSCAVCGSWGPDSLPLRDKALPDLGVPVSSCADLETTAGLVDVDSSICQNIQLFSTYCGCRRAPDACTLCWDGRDVTNPRTQLPNYRTTDFFVVGTERILDCESLQSYMHRRHNESQFCFDVQLDVGEQCGCPSIPLNARSSTNNTTTNTTLFRNSTTPGYPVNATNSTKKTRKKCTLCENGDPPPFPDMRVDLGREVVLTCGEWDRSAWVLEADSGDCGLMRAASRLCGCPVREDQCTMCPHREPVPWPDRHLNWLEESFLSTERSEFLPQKSNNFLTCGLMESIVARDDNSLFKLFAAEEDLVCLATQMKSWICGCKPDWRAILLTWCYRTSGILSCLVSSFGRGDLFGTHTHALFSIRRGLPPSLPIFYGENKKASQLIVSSCSAYRSLISPAPARTLWWV